MKGELVSRRGWKSIIMRYNSILTLLWFCSDISFGGEVKPPISHVNENTMFPLFIPRYEVRRDANNVMVTRGDLEKKLSNDTGVIDFANDFELKNIGKMKKRVSYAQFESAYQCANNKPDLESTGALGLMRMAPPTMSTVEWAWYVVCSLIHTSSHPFTSSYSTSHTTFHYHL